MPALRPLTGSDNPLLRIATLGNLNWREERFSMDDVETRPEFARYTTCVADRGDFGFVAEDEDKAIGVVWALFLPAHDPGYGFVEDGTPEIGLWVHEDERGRGVGRQLLRAIKEEARRRGVHLSLSVEAENQARTLYEHEGFSDVPGRAQDGVMRWSGQ